MQLTAPAVVARMPQHTYAHRMRDTSRSEFVGNVSAVVRFSTRLIFRSEIRIIAFPNTPSVLAGEWQTHINHSAEVRCSFLFRVCNCGVASRSCAITKSSFTVAVVRYWRHCRRHGREVQNFVASLHTVSPLCNRKVGAKIDYYAALVHTTPIHRRSECVN